MLKSLSIRNVVLIESLDIDFSNGLTVLSGETGAGKSILLDSLGLLLGNRSETSLIRAGADKLTVTGIFETSKNNNIYKLINDYDLEVDDEIIIKRIITKEGKSKIFFNDQPITLKLLKELSSNLIEIHGQHDNQGLLNQELHCEILDTYGNHDLIISKIKDVYKKLKSTQKELKTKEEELEKIKQDEENISHWIKELEKASIKKGEEETLKTRRTELMNAEKIIEKLNTAYTSLNGAISVVEQITKARNAISKANEYVNGKYQNIEQVLETSLYSLNDIILEIENSSSNISLSQNEIDNIETRLFLLKDLAKKHHTEIELLPDKLEELKLNLSNIQHKEEHLDELKQAVEDLKQKYISLAKELNLSRQTSADRLDKNIAKELPSLKMEKAKFKTSITSEKEENWTETGWDKVCFEVSTNPNTPFGALNKIASGGELSRFMLALKVNLMQNTQQETLIFDEIDTGIGGATAEAVGQRLSRLSKYSQIFIVTHSPQVASFGDNHFKVEKITKDSTTTTHLTKLDSKGKTEEIARMLAGETITNEARAAANVLINKNASDTLF